MARSPGSGGKPTEMCHASGIWLRSSPGVQAVRAIRNEDFCRCVVFAACAVGTAAAQEPSAQHRWLPATAEKLPRWRGFNLLENFSLDSRRKPFREEDFRLISKLGFNFVRLPMDYRLWIKDGNWEELMRRHLGRSTKPSSGTQIMAFTSRSTLPAPGYTVASPPEKPDSGLIGKRIAFAQALGHVCPPISRHPQARLSFNLMNEPSQVEPAAYVVVVRKLVEAIRAKTRIALSFPTVCNGGNFRCWSCAKFRIAQATGGYAPVEISHYKASWVDREFLPIPSGRACCRPTAPCSAPSSAQSAPPPPSSHQAESNRDRHRPLGRSGRQ